MKNYVKKYKGHDVPEGAIYYVDETDFRHASFCDENKNIIRIIKDGPSFDLHNYKAPSGRTDLIELPIEDEWLPEVGEWCEVSEENNEYQKCYYIGKSKYGKDVYEIRHSLLVRSDNAKFRPLKSEREEFIDKFDGMSAGEMYDNGARIVEVE